MSSTSSRRVLRRSALIAVLQSLLLISSLVLTPALVIAQEVEPGATEPAATEPVTNDSGPDSPPADPDQSADGTSGAGAEPGDPGAKPDGETRAKPDRSSGKPDRGEAGSKVAEKAADEPALDLFIYSEPRKLELVVGEDARLSAWLCPLPGPDASPFGEDREPGTADDACVPEKDAEWSVKADGVATLNKEEGARARLMAVAVSEGTRVIAEVGERYRTTRDLIIQAAPVVDEQPVGEPDAADEPKAAADEPKAAADEPKAAADDKAADDKAADDKATDDQPADEPKAADEQPADETSAEDKPAADEPKSADEPKATDEQPADEQPADETPAEDKPAADEPKPADEQPADETPADEQPADEQPADEQPADETPADEQPADEQPADEQPADETPADETPADEQPADETPADETPADEQPADETPSEELPAGELPAVEASPLPVIEPSAAPSETPAEPQVMRSSALEVAPTAAGDSGVGGAADLDQCANGGVGGTPTNCNPDEWVNGNLNQSKAHYAEGEVIPYRMKLSDLSTGGEIHELVIEWDTTKSGLHALDYITTFDVTVAGANPCVGVAGCSGAADDSFAIPADPQVTGAGITPIPGSIQIWGGDITGVSGYSYATGTGFAGDKSARISIFFTADVTNPVIAWGGHIASRADWGIGMAAGTISGSPYHMRLIRINDKGGNQDRSLSAAAVFLQAIVRVVKQATPADDTEFDFTATNLALASFTLTDPSDDTRQFINLEEKTVTVAESAAPGWDLTFDDPPCTVQDANGGDQSVSGRTITIELKEGEIYTCTFYNDRQEATLTLEKTVVNDNGGTATESDFQARIDGNDVDWDAAVVLDPGSHSASEIALAGGEGYTASSWGGDCAANGSVSLAPGDEKTCTITNDDDAPSLVLAKTVINDNGGDASAADFTLFADALSVAGSAAGSEVTDQAGSYDLSESAVAGYSLTSITCDDAPGTEVTGVTLGLGETITCTFVNDDDAPSLTLVKHVVNDNGGDATAADWTLSAGANDVTGSESGALATDQAGTYALSESSVAGYTNTSITCDDAPGTEVTSVTLGLGETITCTFVNDDDAPSLVLAKTVINDNGGDASAADFTLFADALSVAGSAAGSEVTDQAGSYDLSESAVAGYSLTSITCDDAPGTEVTGVTLGLGETITCTFVNDDDAPSLTLVKHVVNDNGGDATAADWTLSAGANDVTGSESGALATDQAGTYALSESSVAGYTNTSITCDDAPGTEVTSVTLGLGETITCTFVNDDDAPSLVLAKTVINDNGGDASAADFTLFADALSVAGSAAGSEVTDQAGSYDLSESAVAGYSLTSITCDDAPGTEVTGVTLGLGETITCTFVNDDDAPSLTLVKHVVNDNGGDATAADWTLSAGANDVTGSESGALATDQAGTYALSESSVAGYTNTSITCDDAPGTEVTSVTLGLGETITCTFVNDDQQATITVVKVVAGGTAAPDDFDLTLEGQAVTSGVAVDVDPGTYSAAETLVDGYVFAGYSGDCDASGDTTVALGEHKTCTLTNESAALDIDKTSTETTYSAPGDVIHYSITATNVGVATLDGVVISDPLVDGLADFTCTPTAPATLASGESMTCTGTYTITQADIDSGMVLNTACVDDDEGGAEEVCDDHDVPGDQTPDLDIDKLADVSTFDAVGDVITYTITATNSGNVTLEDVVVTDEMLDVSLADFTCDPTVPAASLAPGDSIVCTGTYTITQADLDAGSVLNTACVDDGEGDGASGAVEVCDDVDVPGIQRPALSIEKASAEPTYDAVGDIIHYTVTATNTGNVTLQGVIVTDEMLDVTLADFECTPAIPVDDFAPGDQIVCTGTYTITQADVDDGIVLNTACADDGEGDGDTGGDEVCADHDVPGDQTPDLDIVKEADVTSYDSVGDVISYTITATNSGNVTLEDVVVTDEMLDVSLADFTCDPTVPAASLAPGDSIVCTGTYTITQADLDAGSVLNTACVDDGEGDADPACDEVDVPGDQLPAIEIVKTGTFEDESGDGFAQPGETITYTFVVTNTGNVTLTNVTVTDPLPGLGAITCDPAQGSTLAPTEVMTCNAGYPVTQADIDAGEVDNLATVTGTDPDDEPVTDDDPETVPLPQTPDLDIVKEADVTSYDSVGDVISYTITATNSGNVTLEDVVVTDEMLDVSLADFTCDPTVPAASLAPGDSIVCTGTYTITQADLDAGSVLNTACVDDGEGDADPACDEVDVPGDQLPAIEIVKTGTFEDESGDGFAQPGETITYTFVVTNTGNVTLTNVTVTDPLPGLGAITCDPAQGSTLAPTEVMTCNAGYPVTQADIDAGEVDNLATVTGTDPDDEPVTDDDPETVPLPQTPDLDIVKEADVTSYDSVGDVISYTITATNSGNVTLEDVVVTDEMLDVSLADFTCDPTVPAASLAPGDSIVCTGTYTITQADLDAGSVLNTACVDDGEGDADPACDEVDVPGDQLPAIEIVKTGTFEDESGDGFAQPGETITYTFVVTNTGNVTLTNVTVTDPLPGLGAITCDPAQGSTLAPTEVMTCNAGYPVTQADIDAGEVDNLATVTGTDPDDEPVTDDDPETVPLPQTPDLDIDKLADVSTFDAVGDVISYTITATNSGNVTLEDVVVTDEMLDVTLADFTCDPTVPAASLAPGDSIVCTGTYTITQADLDAGSVLNTACVDDGEGDGASGAAEVCDDVDVPGLQDPALSIQKSVVDLVATPNLEATIVYDVVVTSTGNVTTTYDLTDVPDFGVGTTITNIAVSASTPPVAIDPYASGDVIVDDQTIVPGEVHTFTVTVDFTIDEEITAEGADCVLETDETGTGALNTATVTFVGGTLDSSACAPVPSGGGSGGGGGGGGGQPPTDTLVPTEAATAASTLGGVLSGIVWIILTAAVIVLAGWVIRRHRYSEILLRR